MSLLAALVAPFWVIGSATSAGAKPNTDPPGQLVEIQLLGFNDYHGHVEGDTAGDLDGQMAGGGEYLSTALHRLRTGHKYSLTVAAGDLIGGSPFFSGLFHDEPSVETLNTMGLDVSGVGNHEFDEGVDELRRMQDGGCHPVDGCYFPDAPYTGAEFPWLAANVIDTADGEPVLAPYWIEKVNSEKIAFIGMTLETTDVLVAQSGVAGLDFLDEAETANALVPELRAQGVEAIVVLLHEGMEQNPAPGDINACNEPLGPILAINAALDPAIDVVITGHTHQPYNCVLDGRIVTSAYSYGRVVTEVNLVVDKRTGDVRRDLSTATNHPVVQADLEPDPAVTAVLDRWRPLAEAAGNRPVGAITADVLRAGTPPGADRGTESAAGNLVADAQLHATTANGAQIALMNPGGVRADLTYGASSAGEGDGIVTYGEAFTFQPFGNFLYTIPMTGSELRAVLEEQCQPAGSSRPFLHLGVSEGLTYGLAATITGGECTSVTVSDLALNGEPIAPTDTVQVTVNNFLADGGDNFATLATIDPGLRVGGGIDLDALIGYLDERGPVTPPSTDRVEER
ncbi:MAG: bifunctional metallophosphatase/5'-nucleotidase [Acidimicrobiales bacterium]